MANGKNKAPLVQAPENVRSDLEVAFTRMVEARAQAEKLEAEWKALRDNILVPAVIEYGDHTKPELPQDSILQVGSHKLQWVGSIRKSFDQGRGFVVLQGLPDLYRELVVLTPTISQDRYKVALAEGRVPQELREAVEVEQEIYCLKYWPVRE